jgi:phenylpyruvate tautomerase PptA (4-oxalocrotonate tautomerase family)
MRVAEQRQGAFKKSLVRKVTEIVSIAVGAAPHE